MSIENFKQRDAWAEAEEADAGSSAQLKGNIHISVQQRTGRKCWTHVEGLPANIDWKLILKHAKNTFNTSGSIKIHPKLGKVVQLHGDHRKAMRDFLVDEVGFEASKIQIHGY